MNTAMNMLQRFGVPCTVKQVSTTRTVTNGVSTTSITHEALCYLQKVSKTTADGLNPTPTRSFLVTTLDNYQATTADKLTLGPNDWPILATQSVADKETPQYQIIEV